MQNSLGLCFTSPGKHPSRKMNPVGGDAKDGKKSRKTSSKNKISVAISKTKDSCSREKLKFRGQKQSGQIKNVTCPEESQSGVKNKHQACSENNSISSDRNPPKSKHPLGSSLGERLNKVSLGEELKLKDRKFSDNIHDVMGIFEQLRTVH